MSKPTFLPLLSGPKWSFIFEHPGIKYWCFRKWVSRSLLHICELKWRALILLQVQQQENSMYYLAVYRMVTIQCWSPIRLCFSFHSRITSFQRWRTNKWRHTAPVSRLMDDLDVEVLDCYVILMNAASESECYPIEWSSRHSSQLIP